ncbi:MAG: hypothetical protein LBS67_02180 [Clostridiales Family XIII bacterium]|jgi:hypothetical protein|nr:hypothetical protein [Clostridiales Family XIII bacterium]
MSLSTRVRDDLEDGIVWFNEDDFAEYHVVNGARVLCELGAMRSRPEKIGRVTGGAYSGSSYIFIRAADFTRAPKPDEPIDIDGVRYRITNVMDDLGVYVIEYRRYDDDKLLSRSP